ncbi:hypothetical protein D5086_018724 [Populus alba]|uniref:Uncharacterized protein n=1 Tax=Populus alba TaxID=43335 RepID=A0ACC4BQK9_POPAL
MYSNFKEQAIEYVKQAVQEDNAGNYSKAFPLYMNALEYFKTHLKYEKNPKIREAITQKFTEYLRRAEEIRTVLDEGGPGPNSNGDAAVATRPKTKPKDGEDGDDPEKDKLRAGLNSAIVREKPNVKWNDVAGLESAKQALQEAVILPVKFPQFFTGKRRPWRAFLLYGPPGTGKSYLAKAVATEAESTFFSVSSSDLVSKWMGESEKLVSNLFQMARESAPSIIFVDEIDSLCGQRGEGNESEASRRIKTELLVQMQGVGTTDQKVLVLAATNTPYALDQAIRRRFDKRIYIPLPDLKARQHMFKVHLGDTPHNLTESDFESLARRTEGFSGSDISVCVKDVLFEPVRKTQDAMFFIHTSDDMWMPCGPKQPGAVQISMQELAAQGLAEKLPGNSLYALSWYESLANMDLGWYLRFHFADKEKPNDKLHTTHSWDFLGVNSPYANNQRPVTSSVSDVIVGVIDTGFWPDSESFSDTCLGTVPVKFKGECVAGENFTSANCNRKVVGARFYFKGFEAENGPLEDFGGTFFRSARDSDGHGSHSASTIAGAVVSNVSLFGMTRGTARGGAPYARLAIYKACWFNLCNDGDILSAMDDAINDGVDILSLSFGANPPEPIYFESATSVGAFRAFRKGIVVSCSAGNSFSPKTSANVAPWILTVAASSLDREFDSNIYLGNLGNSQILKGFSLNPLKLETSYGLIAGSDAAVPAGEKMSQGKTLSLPRLVYRPRLPAPNFCMDNTLDRAKIKGKVVECTTERPRKLIFRDKSHISTARRCVNYSMMCLAPCFSNLEILQAISESSGKNPAIINGSFVRAKRVTDPLDDKAKARLVGRQLSYVSSGSEHSADEEDDLPCLSELVHGFLENDDSDLTQDSVNGYESDSDRVDSVADCKDFVEGHNAAICKTKWESSGGGGLTAGGYEFIDVVPSKSSTLQNRYVVDLDFASQFEIARPTSQFLKLLHSLPRVFVGRSEDLKTIVKSISDASKRSLKSRELSLPPWRKNRYMQNKWFGPYRRTVNPSPATPPSVDVVKCRCVGFDDAVNGRLFVRTR